MAGTLDYFSDLLGRHKKNKLRKPLQTVELKVRMDCEGCERKVRKALDSMKDIESVDIDRKQQKVTVTGYVDPNKVLKRVKRTGKRAEFWPYVPYNAVSHPYTAQSYDKKAPPGFVRNVEPMTSSGANPAEDQYTTLFSEENPSSCAVM